MRTKALGSIIAVVLFAAGCGSKPAFKEAVADLIHTRCVAGMQTQGDSRKQLQEAGRTVEEACTCALDLLAENYSVSDLTIMGDETMDIVFTNAGRTCAARFAED